MLNWDKLTIAKTLREASKKWGSKEALISKRERLTYLELYKKVCQLSWGFKKIGIEKGDHVATIFGTIPEWVIIKYALHILGAVIVPINMNFKAKEIGFILKQADVNFLVTIDKLRVANYLDILTEIDPEIPSSKEKVIHSKVLPLLRKIICLSPEKRNYLYCYNYLDVLKSGKDFKMNEIDNLLNKGQPEDICNILFTSGSTAFPKGAVHIHKSILGVGEYMLGKTFKLNSEHRILCFLPFYHVAGCVYYTLGALTSGCALYVNEFNVDEILHIIQRERIDFYPGFEYHFNSLLSHPNFREYNLTSVSRIQLAAGPEWYDRCKKIFPKAKIIANHYGFTEGTGVSVMPAEKDYEIRKKSNGKPWPGIEVKVIDPVTGERVPPNQPGELCLRGWSRFREYYKNPEETKKAIDGEGFFHSGDYGWMDEKENVTYRGRYKMMIKSGGENVSEKEVEVFLESIPGVKAVAVIGIPDPNWGEAVTAIVEVDKGVGLTKEEIIEICKRKIARFKIPKYIYFIEGGSWPILGAGKINKMKIKEWVMKKNVGERCYKFR